MTWTQLGIDYTCLNFGNANNCCVSTGLSWQYVQGGSTYPETGGTAQIVSRLASGLIDSLTMLSPATGTFTQIDLNTANGGIVTLQDAQEVTLHDDPGDPGGQWCYNPPPPQCSPDGITQCQGYDLYACIDGVWVLTEQNSTQCGYPPAGCSEYLDQITCEGAGCYWYQQWPWDSAKCNQLPQSAFSQYFLPIVGGVGAVVIVVAIASSQKKQKKSK